METAATTSEPVITELILFTLGPKSSMILRLDQSQRFGIWIVVAYGTNLEDST